MSDADAGILRVIQHLADARKEKHRSKSSIKLVNLVLSVCSGLITFCIFIFYVLIGVLLQDMVESFLLLLFKDELLTSNINKVMAI